MRINPEQIENLNLDDEFDFETMLNESERNLEDGKIQEGVIVRIDNDFAMVAISGAKQEGRLPVSEIQDEKGNLLFKVGDKLEVYVAFNNERSSISYKKFLKMKKLDEKIASIKDDFENLVINAKIIKKNRGGYVIEFDGVEAFLPKRESALREDGKSVGKTFKMQVIGVNAEEKSIVVSRRKYLDNVEKDREKNLQRLLNENKALEGVVSKITSFGMFVEVEGVEGLVHYTEISHKGPVNPALVAKVGDRINVKILGYDADKKRLSFSVKATLEDPWGEIKDQLDVGDTIRVIVSKIENYGVFVDLGNGTEGFLHISEISWNKQMKHPSEALKEGQEIDVEIIEIDAEKRRLRVSLKKLTPKPFLQFRKKVQVGDILEGKIVKIADFGIFVNLGEVDGLLHNEDISWDRNKKSSDFKLNQEIKVKVLKIDEVNEKVSLSAKALEESPVDCFAKTHPVDSIVKGNVVDIKDFGVFVSLGNGIEALIRDEDLHPLKKDEVKIGDEIEGAVAYIDFEHAKIRVSVKKLERVKEREQFNQYNSDTKMTLGDILKNRK